MASVRFRDSITGRFIARTEAVGFDSAEFYDDRGAFESRADLDLALEIFEGLPDDFIEDLLSRADADLFDDIFFEGEFDVTDAEDRYQFKKT